MSSIRSGFTYHINKSVRPLRSRSTANFYLSDISLKTQLQMLFAQYRSGEILFKILVREIYTLIVQYDFDHVRKALICKNDTELTYIDEIVSLLWEQPTSENFKNLKVLVCNYLYGTPSHKKELIKRVNDLIKQYYYQIMNVDDAIPLEDLYSHSNLEVATAYLWLLSDNMDDLPEMWKLIDNSLVYCYQLCNYIENQIKYFDILAQKDVSNWYNLSILQEYQQKIKKLIDKFPNWLICLKLNPNSLDEYRIYYAVNSFQESSAVDSITNLKLASLEKCSCVAFVINALTHLPPHLVNVKTIEYFIQSSQKLMKNSDIEIDHMVNVLHDINSFIRKNIGMFSKYLVTQIETKGLFQDWLHCYLNLLYLGFNLHHRCLPMLDKDLSSYSYAVVTIQDQFKLTLGAFQIFDQAPIIQEYFEDDLKYQFRELIIVILSYACESSIRELISSSEICAFWLILNNWFEKQSDQEIKYIDNWVSKKNFNWNQWGISNRLLERLNQIRSKETLNEIDQDEYNDPITGDEIITPRKLPLTNQILEKNVIYRILRSNPHNPYNSSPLSIKYLEEYNRQPKIIQEMNDFMERKRKEKLKLAGKP